MRTKDLSLFCLGLPADYRNIIGCIYSFHYLAILNVHVIIVVAGIMVLMLIFITSFLCILQLPENFELNRYGKRGNALVFFQIAKLFSRRQMLLKHSLSDFQVLV